VSGCIVIERKQALTMMHLAGTVAYRRGKQIEYEKAPNGNVDTSGTGSSGLRLQQPRLFIGVSDRRGRLQPDSIIKSIPLMTIHLLGCQELQA
jgi:hypothetical protein